MPELLLMVHDLPGARAAVAGLAPDNSKRFDILGEAALEDGDPASIALLAKATSIDAPALFGALNVALTDSPYLALAKARFGDVAGATALIATTPADCFVCLRARGTIAAAANDPATSERWFAEAIRQTPDLPQGYVDRGVARLQCGDAEGALSDARAAHQRGPHDADALKLWAMRLWPSIADNSAEAKIAELLVQPWDCIVVGGGIRVPSQGLQLFERVINAVHRGAPGTPIAFNTSPNDTGDAAARWLDQP